MEKFKILVYALFGVFMCLGFTACSDDKDEPEVNIIGTWVSVETSSSADAYGWGGFDEGTKIKFLKDGKCFIGWDGIFETEQGVVADPTENQWGWHDESGRLEDGETYVLKGENLTIMEDDLDRWIGTITVNGDEMVFSHIYQNWNYDLGAMVEEDPGKYVTKFRRLK